MKLYFHVHISATDTYITAAVETDNTDEDLKSCLKPVCKCLEEKASLCIDLNNLKLFNDKKKPVQLTDAVASLGNGVDLTVQATQIENKNKIVYEKSDIRKVSNGYGLVKHDGKSALHCENDEVVAPLLKKALQHASKKRNDLALLQYKEVLSAHANNHDALFGAAYIYYKAERYKDCVPYFEKLVSKGASEEVTVLLDFSRALTKAGDPNKAASVISRCINDLKRLSHSATQIHDANVALGEALESMGQLPNAFQLYLTVSQMTEKQHLSALIGYARIGYQINHVSLDDVFIVILNAVAHRKNDTKFHSYFADMVQENGGYDALRKQMHDLWFDAQTVLYIGTFLRECGALEECLKLVKHAFSLSASNNVALLVLHIHENLCLVQEGLAHVAGFFNSSLEHQVVRRIDLSPFAKVIKYIEKNETEQLETYVCQQLAPEKEAKMPLPKGNLSSTELELLALYFTVVKIFYVNGYLSAVPLFIKLLDPLFKANEKLHLTSIRNEQAYYRCMSQIYETLPPPTQSTSATPKLYFVGESHVLPAAWRTVKGTSNEFTIHPVLVTGLKINHLRKESRFYTKFSLQHALNDVPQGAACVFAFGEIDCREGIVRAVEKCSYDSVEECMKSLVEVYVKCLLDVQKKKKAKIFVHPVPPVLAETLENVVKFNTILKARVVKTPKLLWLDFFDDLLDGEGGQMKAEYEFDGTHLNPSYLSLLERSIEKHL